MAFISVFLSAFGGKATKIVGALLAVVTSAFTFWKTVIYIWYADAYLTPEAHAFTSESFWTFYFPTAFWVIFPLYTLWMVPRKIVKAIVEPSQQKSIQKPKRQWLFLQLSLKNHIDEMLVQVLKLDPDPVKLESELRFSSILEFLRSPNFSSKSTSSIMTLMLSIDFISSPYCSTNTIAYFPIVLVIKFPSY